MNQPVKTEKDVVPKLNSTHDLKIFEAQTKHVTTKVAYFGALLLIITICFACLYIFIFLQTSAAFDDASKFLFFILGAATGLLFNNTSKRPE